MALALASLIILATIIFVSLAWWDHTREYRLGGTYRIQCRLCKEVGEIENPTVEELREQQRVFNTLHQRCWQERTGP